MKNRMTQSISVFLLSLCISPLIFGAEFKLVPVDADGPHGIIDQEIRLVGGGQRIQLEVRLSGWDPDLDGSPTLRGWQATIDSCSYGNQGSVCNGGNRNGQCCVIDSQCLPDGVCENPGPVILPPFEPCTVDSECDPSFAPGAPCIHVCIGGDNNGVECASDANCPGGGICSEGFCRPGFIDDSRPDYIFFGLSSLVAGVAINSLNYAFGGALFFDSVVDNGSEFYSGTLVLDVPFGAIGSYTISFIQGTGITFMSDAQGNNIPVNVIPAIITVVCETNVDCNDGNLCTTDVCNPDGTCTNDNNFDDTAFCCNPATGGLTALDDGNDCTDNICNANGTVDHPPLPEFAACGDQASSDCDNPDSCDGAGNCLPRLESAGTACGDPTDTDCNGADSCDNAGNCLTNFAIEGTACGDVNNTLCDNPDSCDAIGNCLLNQEPDGTICNDGLFCTVNDACLNGQCSDNTPRDCDDGLPCTTDTCNDITDLCDNTLDAGFCLIANICYAQGAQDPTNDCMECNTILSTTDWVPREDGSACDDGDPCTGTGRPGIGMDTCTGGVCAGVTDSECNDDCAFAIEATQGTTLSNNSSAGPDDAEASCQPDSNNDIWFIYTAPCNTTVFVSTTGTVMNPSNDPVLSVFDACPDVGGVEIACDDDSGIGLQAALTFNAIGGLSYRIRVAGFENNAGTVTLNIDLVNDCLIDGVCYADGELNPENSCEECNTTLSTTSWTPLVEGSTCGSPVVNECDNPDACNGAGICETNFKPDGTDCSDEGNVCTKNFCIAGVCSHPPEATGFPCGDPTDTECDNPDSCDGTGICLDNFEDNGFACGDPSITQCDLADICDGAGNCTDNLAPDGTECDDADVCTGNDICNTGLCAGVPIPEAPDVVGFGPRNIRVTPLPSGSPAPVALRITSPDWLCLLKYIDVDGSLTITPVSLTPGVWGTISLKDPDIVPDSIYVFEAICGEFTSPAGSGKTSVWGDVDLNGIADIADILIVVDGWLGLFNVPLEVMDLAPCIPDGSVDIRDILKVVDAWLGVLYPCVVPCP